jgi:hypothetical protein
MRITADTIFMTEQGTQLNEVVIKQESAPVTIKPDTVEFNAGSFKTEPNAQVEELLKKLPGMEVARGRKYPGQWSGSEQSAGRWQNHFLAMIQKWQPGIFPPMSSIRYRFTTNPPTSRNSRELMMETGSVPSTSPSRRIKAKVILVKMQLEPAIRRGTSEG